MLQICRDQNVTAARIHSVIVTVKYLQKAFLRAFIREWLWVYDTMSPCQMVYKKTYPMINAMMIPTVVPNVR